MRNHEHYHDPTAGTALKTLKNAKTKKRLHLTYFIGEIKSFRVCRKIVKGRKRK